MKGWSVMGKGRLEFGSLMGTAYLSDSGKDAAAVVRKHLDAMWKELSDLGLSPYVGTHCEKVLVEVPRAEGETWIRREPSGAVRYMIGVGTAEVGAIREVVCFED